MKKQSFISLSMLLLSGLVLTSCANHQNGSSLPSSVDSEITTTQTQTSTPIQLAKRLQIKTPANKLEFEVGEAFTSEGLKVELVEYVMSTNEIKSKTETSDYRLSIKEGTILEEGLQEVMIIGSEGVRSTSYEINVVNSHQIGTLYEVIKKMVDLNNYTVNNDMGQENHVTGLITKDALIWDATEEAYFMDEDFGYGSYDNKTFRFNISNENKITNAIYLTDLGGNAEDHGLFNINTVDNMAERRISNYNIKDITPEDLAYLKDEIKPTEENPNKYLLSIDHCKWLFNAIGHTQLTINPYFFLTSGSEPAKIWLEVKEYGLDIDLITFDTFGVRGCSASITDIGTTEIPGMKEFLKNPTFTKPKTTLDRLQELFVEGNYEFIFNDETRNVIFTKDYVYGSYLSDRKGNNYNSINLKANNTLNKQAGTYAFTLTDDVVSIGERVEKSCQLTNFDIFNNLDKYFIQDEVMLNRYSYNVEANMFEPSGLKTFMDIFSNYENQVIDRVSLEFMMAGDSIYQVTFDAFSDDSSVESITITNFYQANNPILDSYVNGLY